MGRRLACESGQAEVVGRHVSPLLVIAAGLPIAANSRDWLDYATFAVATFAALATVSAVIVALFGPRWRARQRRPVVSVRSTRPAMFQSQPKRPPANSSPATAFTLELSNQPGKETARDVEVFVSFARAVNDEAAIGGPERVPLASGLTVPPNFERPVSLLLIGNDEMIRQALGTPDAGRQGVTAHHTLSLATSSFYGPMWLDPASYDMSLFVTGANFDAKRFDGALLITRDDEGTDRVSTTVRWEDKLREVPRDAPRRRRPPAREEVRDALAQEKARDAQKG